MHRHCHIAPSATGHVRGQSCRASLTAHWMREKTGRWRALSALFFWYGDLDGGVGEKRLAERKEEEDRGSGSDK